MPASTLVPSGGAINATYNPSGELLSIATGVGSTHYLDMTWDPLARLASVRQSPSGDRDSYVYNAAGLRVARSNAQEPAWNRTYAYTAKGKLLAEYLRDGSWGRDVVYLDDRAIAEIDRGGVHELHSDRLQSPRLVTSGATGAMDGTQSFAPCGERLANDGYVPLTGYTGHLQTEPNGLIYMKGRFYSPAWHRFLNSDPGADPDQWNLYAYCGGRPLTDTDPTGLWVDLDSVQKVLHGLEANLPVGTGMTTRMVLHACNNYLQSLAFTFEGTNREITAPTLEATLATASVLSILGAGGNNIRVGSAINGSLSNLFHRDTSNISNLAPTNHGNQLYPVYLWDYTGSLIPHTFIQTHNMTNGFYHKDEYHYLSAFVTVPGEVRNDDHHPHNDNPTRLFWVDAQTLSRVEQGMSWSPQLYELNNGFWNHAYNCTGWANQVLAGAGLKSSWSGVGANPWTN